MFASKLEALHRFTVGLGLGFRRCEGYGALGRHIENGRAWGLDS